MEAVPFCNLNQMILEDPVSPNYAGGKTARRATAATPTPAPTPGGSACDSRRQLQPRGRERARLPASVPGRTGSPPAARSASVAVTSHVAVFSCTPEAWDLDLTLAISRLSFFVYRLLGLRRGECVGTWSGDACPTGLAAMEF